MREKNLVRRRYCRGRATVSELFVKGLRRRGKDVKREVERM